MSESPIKQFVEHQGVLVLDGGLATTLEDGGADLNHDLWSAVVLVNDPDSIRRVHMDFLRAGADCIVSSTYQASIPGLMRHGMSEQAAIDLIRFSVDLATEVRDEFWSVRANREGRIRPIVAASVGPYGAFLSDGSEYTGRYGVGVAELDSFHRSRWQILVESSADLIACETIPSKLEASFLLQLLRETPDAWGWMSFSCRDGHHISDGTPIREMAKLCDAEPGVAAVGINCTPPEFIPSLIREVRSETGKPIVVYPNSGDRYDASSKSWRPHGSSHDWATEASLWATEGADCIGGCCRVGPNDIEAIRGELVP